MGYMHINNLYKDVTIMDFKECYAMEKVHGTSARLQWKDNKILYHPGGCKYDTFVSIFNTTELEEKFMKEFKDVEVTVYGEQYGGKQQGMSETYGKEPMFIVFEVQIGDVWLNVPNAEDVANKLGLEFVPYKKIKTDLESLNEERDAPSIVAMRRGMGTNKKREGIVCRPLEEYKDKRGNRIIVKHKRDDFRETKTPRPVDPEKLKILAQAKEIANEWVTEMRLTHVLDKLGNPNEMKDIPNVIKAMVEDIYREGKGEIIESKSAEKAIQTATAIMFKKRISKI